MKFKKLVVLILFCLTYALWANSNSENGMKFDHLTIKDGLSQSRVITILQDRKGFMWFGTSDGLNRYDGYEFNVYRHNPDDLNSLSSNYINDIYEDINGIIWIGTSGGGLNRFDPELGNFTVFKNDPNNIKSLSHNDVRAITQDQNGSLWLGTYGGGLDRFDPTSNQFTHYKSNPDNLSSINISFISSLLIDINGDLWIGTTGGGLNYLNTKTGIFTKYFHSPLDNNSISSNSITTLFQDNEGNLWVGTFKAGLNKLLIDRDEILNINDIKIKRFEYIRKNKSDLSIFDIYQDNESYLWVGTSAGLIKINSNNNIVEQFQSDGSEPTELSDDEIVSVYQDRGNNLWIGVSGSGITKINISSKKFELYQNVPDMINSLNSNDVFSFCEDRSDILWVGTWGGGLNRFDRKSEKITHFLNNPNNRNSISTNYIRSIYQDKKGVIWVGGSGGLNKLIPSNNVLKVSKSGNEFRPDGYQFNRYLKNPSNNNSISNNDVTSIVEDSKGDLWVGTYSGLNRLDPNTDKFTRYYHNTNNSKSLSSNVINCLLIDQNETLWIGTWDGGLNKIDLRSKIDTNMSQINFVNYLHITDDSTSLSGNFIISMFEDSGGTIWIGTTNGLNKFNKLAESFDHYTTKNGLPNNVIYGILEDNSGNLWISTNNGLSKFDLGKEKFINYNESDGIQDLEFNSNACYKNPSGEMFFGGVNGFNAFYPENIIDNHFVPPIVITDFQLFNESIRTGDNQNENSILTKTITHTEKIVLSYRDVFFSFKFAALNFTNSRDNKYAYMMEGFDIDWVYSGNRRFASYTNLDPGNYVFKVKGSNDDNVWNEEGVSVKITIVPPFWETLWFRGLAVLLILGLSTYLYKKRINKIESKKRELQIRVNEKTKAASDLQVALNKVEELKKQLKAENIYLQEEIKLVHNFENIVTQDKKLKSILGSVEQVSSTDATVLILGESGTGKELIARAIHNISERKNKPLVKVNCAALPVNLVESELFGHEKGAFTGAISKKIGRFELADNGTIFLDEIGDLTLDVQAKLLRVLQEGEFERLGSNITQKVNVRLITATNRDLEKSIANDTFRSDLYFRLNVFPIIIPPLRERKDDIRLLTKHFTDIYGKKIGKKIKAIPQNIMDTLISYSWPGNIRELENIIERAIIISPSDKLVLGDWFSNDFNNEDKREPVTLEESERICILKALNATNWRISGDKGAAKILGMKPTTLEYRIKKLGIKKEL
ncbi:sigma 54-interacting transcriptional regulator [Candidatus Neomarinimicrobiota bacterium]